MAYEKQNFLNGQIVTADHLNHIEDGIIAAQNTRNLLDNSDFTNPVNQRGQTTYNAKWQYTIDRWIVASASSDGALSLDITDSGITITNTTGNSYFIQRVPKALITFGNTYTLAYQKSDGTIVVTTIANFEEVGGESYQVIYEIPSGTTIVWAALYKGSYTADTLPPYVPKGYAAELAECKRYYNIIPYDMDDYYVNTNTEFPTIYPVSFSEMRIIPTVTLKENWNTGSAGVSVGYRTKSSLGLQVAATNSRVAWHGKIELSADL